MSSIVAIVGRPNVGKSTFFNRMIQRREAIVDSISGVTRDRNYGKSFWNGKEFSLIDTGGYLVGSKDVFVKEIDKQVNLAIEESDLIIFMVDSESGITGMDQEVAKLLRKSEKKFLLVVNKVDNSKRQENTLEFYKIGVEKIYPISAINGSVLTLSGAPSGSVSGILTFAYANDAAAEAVLSEADYAQYLNQKASRDSATAQGIERIEVTASGTSYTGVPTVTITGDGSGATATAVMAGSGSSQTLSSVTVNNKGTNYTFADITITGAGGSDATARAVISPKAGHGVDPISELGGFFISLNTKLDGNDGGDLTVGNDFRQITLINEPRDYNATPLAGNIATADTLKATSYLDFNSSATVLIVVNVIKFVIFNLAILAFAILFLNKVNSSLDSIIFDINGKFNSSFL